MARLPCVNGPRHSDRSCLASLPALQHVLQSYHHDCRLPIPWNLILKVSSSTSHRRHSLVCHRAKPILTAVAHSEHVSRAFDLLDLCSDFRSSIPTIFTPGSSAGMASYASCSADPVTRSASIGIPPRICRYHGRLISPYTILI